MTGAAHCPSVGKPIAHGLPTAASPLYCLRLKRPELEQIGKLLRLASCFKSGLSATSSWQPLGLPAAGKMSSRWIMPRSSWSRVWQCATKQPTVTGLKYVRNVIDPGVASLMFAGGPAQVEGGAGTHGSRDEQGVVPFGQRQGDTVYLCDQHMILMDVKRMVGE